MKRLITVSVLLLFVLAGVFAGGQAEGEAGEKAQPKEDDTLEVVVFRDNPGQHIPTQELVKEWSEQTGTEVKITIAGHSTRQTVNTTALEGGSGPDIIMMTNFEPHLYAEGLMDLSDMAADIAEENGGWYPIAQESCVVDGEWKAVPVYNYAHMMLYRKDVFNQAGASVPDTWTEFREALQKIKDSDVDMTPFGISIGRSFDGQQFLISVILAHGGQVLSDDGSEVVFDSPETVKALKYVIDLYRDELLDQTAPGWDDGTNNQAMLSGRIAVTFNSNSIKLQAVKDFPDLNPKIGTAIYPAGPVDRVSNPYAMSYGIRKSSNFPEKAKELIRYLFKHENYTKVLRETEGAVGVTLKGFTDLDIWEKEDYDTNLTAMATSRMFAQPSAKSSEVYNSYIIIDMVADVLVNGMTPEAAVEKAAERMEEIYFGG
jgi:multiple sugar transport system substrate-binding protein